MGRHYKQALLGCSADWILAEHAAICNSDAVQDQTTAVEGAELEIGWKSAGNYPNGKHDCILSLGEFILQRRGES